MCLHRPGMLLGKDRFRCVAVCEPWAVSVACCWLIGRRCRLACSAWPGRDGR